MRRLGAMLLISTVGACAVHDVYSFRAAEIVLGDRGISIPVPPPSLTDAPKQDSTVEGMVEFELLSSDEEYATPVSLHVEDRVSGAAAQVTLENSTATFRVQGLNIDHSDNCLSLWLQAPDGAVSSVVQYHTVIAADDQSVRVEPGCL